MIWTDRHGHEFVRMAWDGRTIAHHRILAYAWGLKDTPFPDGTEVDHITEVGWLNAESNLQVLTPSEHSRKTYRSRRRRP